MIFSSIEQTAHNHQESYAKFLNFISPVLWNLSLEMATMEVRVHFPSPTIL